MRREGLVVRCWYILMFSISLTANAHGLELRNFHQLEYYLSNITDVPRSNYNVRWVVENAFVALPQTSDLKEYTPLSILAVSHVAAGYCLEWLWDEMERQPDRRKAHKPVDFDLAAGDVSPLAISSVVTNYANLFWGRDPTSEERQILKQFAAEMQISLPSKPGNALDLFTALCTVTGVALHSMVIVQ